MKSNNRWLILTIVSSALLLIVIDITVLYTALPQLTHDLSASASSKLWILNIYALVVSGLLLGMGTLGDKLGHKRLFIAGLSVFCISSLCAAYSPTPNMLIASRAFLAVGAAMMMPSTLSIIRITFTDDHERALAIGIWASVASGGAAFGPVVGGILLEYFWWGSVFLINVPIILIVLPLAIIYIPKMSGNTAQHWDLRASLQVMVGLIGVAYAIKEISKQHANYTIALITFTVGVIFLTLFTFRQRRSIQPLIEFSLFCNPIFSTAVISAMVSTAALTGIELVLSQRLQLVLSLSPLQAGLFILPIPLSAFIAGPITGYLLPRLNNIKMLSAGLFFSGMGMVGYILLYTAPIITQILCLATLGMGLGATMATASSMIMHSAPVTQAGMVASIEELSYELGGAIGITLMGSIMSVVYTTSLVIPTTMQIPKTARDSLDEALIISENLSPELSALLSELSRSAFNNAFVVVLSVASLMLLVTAIVVWKVRHKKS